MQTKTTPLSGYGQQIQDATNAPAEILPILERIMREEIFHSTLDWQTARQFKAAARKAHKMYREAHFYYDADQAHHAARWAACLAESALTAARQAGDADLIQQAEAASLLAREAHDRALQKLLSFR